MPGAVFQRWGGDREPEFCGGGVCEEAGALRGEAEGWGEEDWRDDGGFVFAAGAEGAGGRVGSEKNEGAGVTFKIEAVVVGRLGGILGGCRGSRSETCFATAFQGSTRYFARLACFFRRD